MSMNDSEQKYITLLLYNGFYAFELMSERSLDSVICGVCGTVGQVYYGDGNEKNCCTCNIDKLSVLHVCYYANLLVQENVKIQ